jgi:hypothetical protein
VSSNNGLLVQVTNTGVGNIHSDHQGNPWMGNFAPGDFLLYADGFFEVTFPQPVNRVAHNWAMTAAGLSVSQANLSLGI